MKLITLKKRADFIRLRDGDVKAVRPALLLQAAASAYDDEAIHLGFTATKKLGNAVIRNRAKRRLRAAAREVLAAQGRADVDYVLIARKNCVQCGYDALCRDLENAIRGVHRKL